MAKEKINSKNHIKKFLDTIEYLGNALPHPAILFLIASVLVLVISSISAYFDLSVMDPRPEGAKGRAEGGIIYVQNLISAEGLMKIIKNFVTNFTAFMPLGTVLVSMLGIGIAEHSGLISAALRAIVIKAPKKLITIAIVFTGILSNTAGELGYVLFIPLAAMIFHALGRHPLAGLAAAFAGVSGGYSANILLGTVDPLLSGITQEAARLIDPNYLVGPEANWYFMISSTFLITVLGYLITEKIIEPQLGKYDVNQDEDKEVLNNKIESLTAVEKKGLIIAIASMLIFVFLLALTIIPENGILRNPNTGSIAGSPFLAGIVVYVFFFFAIPGYIYGRVTGSFQGSTDFIESMAKSVRSMSMYIVLVFFLAQFLALFTWSNLGSILAIKGAEFIQFTGLTGPMLLIVFIFICAFINLITSSASAQWALTAPIFVPMLMLTGYAPEVIQAAYRIGDSTTNIITPMMSYFALILAVATRYKKDTGAGTLIVMMLPYSLAFLVFWSAFFYIWVFVLGIPVGPYAPIYYSST